MRIALRCRLPGLMLAAVAAWVPAAAAESVARRWNESLLAAIRVDVPNPPVHARNLFHLSVAMWDAWAVYDAGAAGYVHRERLTAADAGEARRVAISYAAYRVLVSRFSASVGAAETLPALRARMEAEGCDPDFVAVSGNTPAAVGNRVAASVLRFAASDGSNEAGGYADSTYAPVNPPLIVGSPGTGAVNPNRWQPLALAKQVAQNGIELPEQVQSYIGAVVPKVRPFALEREAASEPWMWPGAPPQLGGLGDAACKQQQLEVLRFASWLSPDDGVVIDISPGAMGNNPPASNAGTGHPLNPATGLPYAANPVKRGDYGRVLAEYWADGPHSETPPGHWNLMANQVADHPAFTRRWAGVGPELDALEWDVRMYFVLNAALHDAACTAWTLKRYFDSARPITLIRYMAQRGQSTTQGVPSWHPQGLPLESGLVEIITAQSAAPGGRHAHLAAHQGKIAVKSWPGQPADPEHQTSGVVWMTGETWVPYQRNTFVTPAFPGYISGHSTFSRAAAEVLTAATGSPFFPGGLSQHTVPAGALIHEEGPSAPVTLQWATYLDAADQAGISRLWGGIHIAADDLDGRKCGALAGMQAWSLAQKYFDGSILMEPIDPVLTLAEGGWELFWPARRGFYYRVERSADLDQWQEILPVSLAEDSKFRLSGITGNDGRAFFRITRTNAP